MDPSCKKRVDPFCIENGSLLYGEWVLPPIKRMGPFFIEKGSILYFAAALPHGVARAPAVLVHHFVMLHEAIERLM